MSMLGREEEKEDAYNSGHQSPSAEHGLWDSDSKTAHNSLFLQSNVQNKHTAC